MGFAFSSTNLHDGPGGAFLRDPLATGRALRRWAWPLKAGFVSAAVVAAVPLLLTAVVALGTGLLVFGVCRLLVIAGDAIGLDSPRSDARVGPATTPSPSQPFTPGVERENVRVVSMRRNA